jgi:HlyD family secretion protein
MVATGGVAVGSDWFGGNPIMTIPDLSAFEIDISISEEYRGRVAPNYKAKVSVEAVPGLQIDGVLKKINDLAQPRSPYDQNGPRAFVGVVALDRADPRMVSGMSTRVEIVTDTLKNALLVPVEAVYHDGEKAVCLVRTGLRTEKRPVTVGKSDDHYVEITQGLSEGEQVSLDPLHESGDRK